MDNVTKSKDCMNCKECCIFEKDETYFAPLFTLEEINKLPKTNFKKYKSNIQQIKLKKHKNKYICPFLNIKTWDCKIYLIRPFDCRIYPFILMKNKEKTKIFLAHFHEACFSLNKQTKKEFNKHANRLKKLFLTKEYKAFLKKYSGLIWDYDEDAKETSEMKELSKLIL